MLVLFSGRICGRICQIDLLDFERLDKMKRYQIRGRFTDWRDVSENRMYEYALQLAEWSTLKSGCVEYFVDRYTRVIEDE